MHQTFKVLLLTFSCIFCVIVANAQITTSAIQGRIADAEGPVPGAAIIATHVPSGSIFTAVSDRKGVFQVNGIVPGGPYTVSIEILGYRKVENTGIYAPLGETVSVNALLEPDAIGLEAAVFIADAAASGMNVRNSGVGTAISQRTMGAVPTVSRSINDVMRLTPQASVTANGFSVGGGNYRSSCITVDGAAFNNAFGIGSNLPAGGAPISLDALEQMSVSITPFDVRHSGFTGGAINAVTKKGSNVWHASVYNYFNSDQLKGDRIGKESADRLALDRSLNNTTGFTLGGPIVKDRLFFFLNAEYSPESVPGASRLARPDESSSFGGGSAFARPTVAFMEEVKAFLKEKYGYDPGRYQNYSVSAPDWKVMARIDWNINRDHRLNFRFSHTGTSMSSDPSSSTNPANLRKLYDRHREGRTSEYALYFESSRYLQGRDFTSAAAELDSRFLEGRLNNVLRLTYSHQNERRSNAGGIFPTVDILQEYGTEGSKAVLTSFGPDPFTLGNIREVHTVVVTDEISYASGINNIVAGLQFEWNNAVNGFMPGGAGYYTYNSWEDFKQGGKPAAFALTFPNNDALDQVYPSFRFLQPSLYVQDELTFSERFKLTAGLRLELPLYPKVQANDNKEFGQLADQSQTMAGLRTDDMPGLRLNVSPRVGFNWDILGNRNLILRGGTGLYTGRLPFVWIISSVVNSNCMQVQYVDNDGSNPLTPGFHTQVKDMVNEIYGGQFTHKEDNFAPTAATILDQKLKMPTTWKSSLALEGYIPGGVKLTLEGIFNKDFNSTAIRKLGLVQVEEGIQLPGEPEPRALWKSEGIRNSLGQGIMPMYLTNTDGVNGYYGSLTAQLQKDFNFGLSLMAAYTFSESKTAMEGIRDQVTSDYGSLYTRNGSNMPELGYASFVSPHRVIANISYRIPQGGRGATTIGLFYEGYNNAYISGFSYSRYSYTMKNVTNDFGADNLLYIPTAEELTSMPFESEENRAAFEDFISRDAYLSRHRGSYSKRGGAIAPWQNRINVKFLQDIDFEVGKQLHTIQLGLDVNNVANLLSSEWGVAQRLSSASVLQYKESKYKFTKPEWTGFNDPLSTWEMLLSLRYFF